ncbi:Tubulin polyglutamylase, partial [Globisporangium splendens]
MLQGKGGAERDRKGESSTGPSSAGSTATGGARASRQVRSSGEGRDNVRSSSNPSSGGGSGGATSSASAASTSNTGGNSKGKAGGSSGAVMKFKTTFRNTIYDTLLRRGWKETSDSDWDFYWADREYIYELLDTVHLENGQKVNHFRNGRELCRKDLLIKNLKRAKRTMEKKAKSEEGAGSDRILRFLPDHVHPPWGVRHLCRAQGKGIFLFTKLSQISDWRMNYRWRPENQQVETYVVQKYISNPYLVGGKKFDLRLYALVPTFTSLEVYLFRGGFARFTNSRYSNNPSDIANSFVHLTNVAIQKTSENYNKEHGGKWDLRNLKLYMMSKHGPERINKLFYEIQMVIIKSLLSIEKIVINDKHCFELYGYDIMIDENLKP